MKNIDENRRGYVPFMLLDIILAQWWHPVVSSEALDLLHWVMRVAYQRTTTAIEMASKVGHVFSVVFFAVAPAAARAIRREKLPDGGIQLLWG
jgi:hypothetical protein